MIFIPNHNSPEVLKPGKKALHFPSAPVRPELASILGFRFLAPFAVRGNHLNLPFLEQSLIKAIAVISLVTDKFIGSILGKAAVNCFLNQFHFMGRSAFNVSGDRKTRSVCDCHDLGAFAALRLADSKAPFFAGAKLPSIKASRMSIWPRSYRSSTSSCAMRLKTPWSTHRWNHLWQVWCGGYRWGISFQGAPVLRIHKMPLKTARRSWVGRPLGSLAGVNFLMIGSIRFHCSFVISILIVLHNQDVMSSFIFNIFNKLQELKFLLISYS
jgi:hypothetical protein